jgi:hypothetical protein
MNEQTLELTQQDLQILSERQLESVAGGAGFVLKEYFPQGIPWPELYKLSQSNPATQPAELQQFSLGF